MTSETSDPYIDPRGGRPIEGDRAPPLLEPQKKRKLMIINV